MFLSVDPLVAISGDPYLYASANPIALSDPTGLCDGSCFISLPSAAVPVGGCSADPDVCNGYNSVEGRSKIRQGWKDEGAWRYRWRDQPRPNTGLPGDGMGYLSVSGGEIWADGRVGPDPATGRYDYDPNEIMWLSDIALNFILGSIGMKLPGSTAPARVAATSSADDLVRFDPQWASRQIAGQNFPGATGYATTPGGNTLSVHAAERAFLGGPGRAPIDPSLIDDILSQGTRTTYRAINDTVKVSAPGLCGKCYVVVDAQTGTHVVTVMVPK